VTPPPPAPPQPPPRGGVAELLQSMHHWLGQAGRAVGGEVYDLTTHKPLYALNANFGRPPASVEKLFTSAALLARLGAGARLQTDVEGTGLLGPGGVWTGDLYLVGGGDPTFGSAAFNKVWEGTGAAIETLVDQLMRSGIRRVSGKVIADATLFDSHPGPPSSDFKPDVDDLGGEISALTFNHGASTKVSPAVFAAQQLAVDLRRDKVTAHAALFTAKAPASAHPLATVVSPPIAALLRLMDVPSDDLYAEMLTKLLGARFAGGGSTAQGASVIMQTLQQQFGIAPRIVDGSGLSRLDRASPAEVLRLLRAMWQTPDGAVLRAALPVVGRTGTVKNVALGTPAAGRCEAKTGTLNGVTNLAGYCKTGGGQDVAFAFFMDGPPNARGLFLLGRAVGDLARLNPTLP
jgi:D-alanyl-D-alanine carboxypeptidase/D-alanyl-D-alanine-endopeptidase (penicillin-binding protein 4)